jgi:adenylate cyclase, class 2
MQETEIKLPLSDLRKAHTFLQTLPLKVNKERHFEDNLVLDTSHQIMRKSGQLLRVRIVGNQGVLTYKGKLAIYDGVRSRKEIECPLGEPQNFLQILENLGYSPTFRYQKYRTVYEIEGEKLHICLDETPIGIYFELEGDIPKIHEYATRLGFERSQYITDSYASLYFRWCKEKGIEPSQMIFV